MKFFYINNALCENCDSCSIECGFGAVYTASGKRYIAHDKCTSCGVCIRLCPHSAVSIESIDRMVERMENADLYLSRIRRLEKELALSNRRLEEASANLVAVLGASPVAMAVCMPSGNVEAANQAFNKLARTTAGGGTPAVLADVVPAQQADTVLTDRPAGPAAVEIGGRTYNIKVTPLEGNLLLCVLDDLSDGRIASARIAEALRRAVDRKMEMVRNIGTLLGDEASSTLNDINAALRLVEQAAESASVTGTDSVDRPENTQPGDTDSAPALETPQITTPARNPDSRPGHTSPHNLDPANDPGSTYPHTASPTGNPDSQPGSPSPHNPDPASDPGRTYPHTATPTDNPDSQPGSPSPHNPDPASAPGRTHTHIATPTGNPDSRPGSPSPHHPDPAYDPAYEPGSAPDRTYPPIATPAPVPGSEPRHISVLPDSEPEPGPMRVNDPDPAPLPAAPPVINSSGDE